MPTATPVTLPEPSTEATAALEELQVPPESAFVKGETVPRHTPNEPAMGDGVPGSGLTVTVTAVALLPQPLDMV